MSQVKICSKCHQEKDISEFYKRKGSKDGLTGLCKSCIKQNNAKIVKKCNVCGKEYLTHNKNSKYCSHECSQEGRKNREIIHCDYCNKTIERKKSKIEKNKNNFCSTECANKYMTTIKGEKHFNYSKQKVFCTNCKKEILISKYKADKFNNHFCSKKCFSEYMSIHMKGENNPVYGKKLYSIRGEKSPHWKKDLTPEEREGKRCIEGYKNFVLSVFRRDNFTCKCCGYDKGHILVAHHLNSYNWDKENRTNPDNGITLCKNCHSEFHKIYGNGDNTLEQFIEFLKNKNINMTIPSQANESHKSS